MCGRYVLAHDGQGMLRSLAIDRHSIDWDPVYSVAPSTMAPIVREHIDDGERVRSLDPARWGFRPSWAKEKGPRPINARYETAATNGMFRSAFTSSRAVVPMDGYYEWVQMDDGKQPYYVHGDGLLLAAGLTTATKREDGEWDVSFTIITREARDAAGIVHDRMPAFLPGKKLGEWLQPGKLSPDERADLHAGLGEVSEAIASTLVTHPVDRQVNSTRKIDRTDPSLIEPIELD